MKKALFMFSLIIVFAAALSYASEAPIVGKSVSKVSVIHSEVIWALDDDDTKKTDDKKKEKEKAEKKEAKLKEIKAEFLKKIEKMKADGATEEEIKKFTVEFKKKMAADGDGHATSDKEKKMYEAYKVKLDKKIEEMKAAGASEEEIKKMITDFKKKVAAVEKDKHVKVKKEKTKKDEKK